MKQILENIDSYINFSLRHILSLLDRDFASKTLGCFDKNYWHYKYKAFPNSMMQTYLYSLSSYLKYIKNNTKKSHLISPVL